MRIKKSLLLAVAVTTIGLAGMGAAAKAATTSNTEGTGLVDKIAQKFNLNKDDVQKVFDEDRQSHEAEHQAKMEERLSQAVTDGKITEEQKTKILAKIKELDAARESEREAMKDKTQEERKTLMEQKRAELEQWAKDNNIPTDYFPMVGFGKGPGPSGPGDGGEFHLRTEDGATSTSN
jgi:hypothetical protein